MGNGSVPGARRLALLAALAAASGCAGETAARRPPASPPALTVLLQRGALASASLSLSGPVAVSAEDTLPDALRPGAARRYAGRSLPAPPRGEMAVARLGGRLVGIAIGDFSAPLVVVEDPGPSAAPRVLLEGGNVRLLVRLPRRMLRDVTLAGAVMAPSARLFGAGASIRLGPGLPVERLAAAAAGAGEDPSLAWVRYRDPEVEVVGVIEPGTIGTVYRPAPAAELTAGESQLSTPIYLFDQPKGRPFATLLRGAGPLITVARVEEKRGYTLVRATLSRDVTVSGWVKSLELEPTVTSVRPRAQAPARGQWISIAGLPGHDLRCVELARATRLHERPGGPIAGLVTRDDRFMLLGGERRPGWLQVGVGHPFGLAHLWVRADRLRQISCDPARPQPGTT